MVGEKLHDLVHAFGIDLLERPRGGVMVLAPPPLEETAVDDILGQRVLEAVHKLGIVRGREDEVQSVEILEIADHLLHGALAHAAPERGSKATPDHRSALQRELERICEPIDTGGDDVVDGRRYLDVAAPEPRFTALDHDPCCLEKLVENLLDVEGIA